MTVGNENHLNARPGPRRRLREGKESQIPTRTTGERMGASVEAGRPV
jgi:hypothetical protein